MPHIYGTGELFTVWCARPIYMYFIFLYRNLYTCNYVTMCDHVRSVLQLVYLLHSQWQLQGNDYCPYIHWTVQLTCLRKESFSLYGHLCIWSDCVLQIYEQDIPNRSVQLLTRCSVQNGWVEPSFLYLFCSLQFILEHGSCIFVEVVALFYVVVTVIKIVQQW